MRVLRDAIVATESLCSELPSTCTAGNNFCGSYRSGVDFVIPTYEKETCRLGLLATSVATYDVCGLVNDIHLGWVTMAPVEDYKDVLDQIRTKFQRQVYVHEYYKLWGGGPVRGWVDQQLFKLAVYVHVSTKWYVAMDCKNIFVHPITLGSLFGHQRMSMQTSKDMAYHHWHRAAAAALDVDLDQDASMRSTVTPFLFNTERVKSIFDFFHNDTDVLHFRTTRSFTYSEFALYEVFSCCNPNRGGEDGAWIHLPLDEAVAHPFLSHLTFHGLYTDDTITSLRSVVDNDAEFDKTLLIGWHKSIPANGTFIVDRARDTKVLMNITFFSNFARAIADILTISNILTTPAEQCDFFTNCASAVVPCDDI